MRIRVYMPESTFDWESQDAWFRVGRGDSCALRFEGESAKFASWEHAEFNQGEGGAAVTDIASSNGTYVNGVRITSTTPIRVGTTVQIGRAGPRLEVLALTAVAPRPIPVAPPAPDGAAGSTGEGSASEAELESSPRDRLGVAAMWGTILGFLVLALFFLAHLPFSERKPVPALVPTPEPTAEPAPEPAPEPPLPGDDAVPVDPDWFNKQFQGP